MFKLYKNHRIWHRILKFEDNFVLGRVRKTVRNSNLVPCPHSKKKNEQREDRIQNMIRNRGNVPVIEILIAYNMRLYF